MTTWAPFVRDQTATASRPRRPRPAVRSRCGPPPRGRRAESSGRPAGREAAWMIVCDPFERAQTATVSPPASTATCGSTASRPSAGEVRRREPGRRRHGRRRRGRGRPARRERDRRCRAGHQDGYPAPSAGFDPAGAGQRRRQLTPVLEVHFREDEREEGLLEVAGSLARGRQIGPVLAVEGVVAMETEADPLEEAPAGQPWWRNAVQDGAVLALGVADVEDDDVRVRRRVFAVDVGEDRLVAVFEAVEGE